jgi:hypothetical protein
MYNGYNVAKPEPHNPEPKQRDDALLSTRPYTGMYIDAVPVPCILQKDESIFGFSMFSN